MAKGVAAVWVPVDDMERAVGFYRDALGFDVRSSQPEWSEIDADGLLIGLNGRETTDAHSDGGAVISFTPDGDIGRGAAPPGSGGDLHRRHQRPRVGPDRSVHGQ